MASTLITTDDVADYIDDDSGDTVLLQSAIDAAQSVIEQFCARDLDAYTTYTEYHDGGRGYIYVIHPPIVSITSITDDWQYSQRALSSDNWIKDTDDNGKNYRIGKVELWKNEGVFTGGRLSVRIVYTGGWTSTSLPGSLRQAWIELAGWMYDHPERVGKVSENVDGMSIVWAQTHMPPAIREILSYWRRPVTR